MARGTTPLKRGKSLGPGKKTLAKQAAMKSATENYFSRFGETAASGYCQLSNAPIYDFNVTAHHKTPRSEMRKAGIKDLDAPHRLLILHPLVHLFFLHAGAMGRPTDPIKAALFKAVEESPVNAETGGQVELTDQHRLDLERFMKGNGL